MELQNCRNCKKIFNYITGERICPACREVLEELYQKVKGYIEENPGKSANDVAEECEVSINQIRKWVREERLVFSSDSLVGLECERCGRNIHSGRFCKDCAGGLADAMTDAFKKQQLEYKARRTGGGKMRFLE